MAVFSCFNVWSRSQILPRTPRSQLLSNSNETSGIVHFVLWWHRSLRYRQGVAGFITVMAPNINISLPSLSYPLIMKNSKCLFSAFEPLMYCNRCTMSLIRGLGGHLPCPICHVPKEQLSDISGRWPLRDAVQTQNLLRDARALENPQRENILSLHGLHDIDVSFLD